MDRIKKYFQSLEQRQIEQFNLLYPLYEEWNEKINLISRKDFTFFYERHVLHSLSIVKYFQFPKGCNVMDAGTGGGFPGIPLAIYFPDVFFHLVDSTGKKIKALETIIEKLNLKNVSTEINRIENVNRKFDFIVSRAVASLQDMLRWTNNKLNSGKNKQLKPGIIYLKGGNVFEELSQINLNHQIFHINQVFEEVFFETKLVVYIYR